MRVAWNALCVCIVIPLIFFRKVKEEEEAEGEAGLRDSSSSSLLEYKKEPDS